MTDVTLVLAPPWSAELPPIGLAYLKRYLETRGRSAEAVDLNLTFYRASEEADRGLFRFGSANLIDLEFYAAFRTRYESLYREAVERIVAQGAPIVGFSINSYNKLVALDIARELKRRCPEVRIVLGGFALSVTPEHDPRLRYGVAIDGGLTRGFQGIDDSQYPYFEDVDYIGIGEGEVLLAELAGALLSGGRDPASIPGVVAAPFPNPAPFVLPPLIHDLDQIPFPTYEGIDIEAYDKRALSLIFSRGCICRCAFCTDPIVWRKYRYRSGAHVVAELRHHFERYGVTDFFANDQIVNGHLPQLAELCDHLIASGLGERIGWGGNCVVRKDMPHELYHRMRKAGCRWLIYGIESGSDTVLAKMNKMFRSATAEEMLKATHDAGIRVCINLIVGFPGEGEAEFDETMAFLERVSPWVDEVANLNPLIISPRTSLEKRPGRFDIDLPAGEHWKYWTMSDGTNVFTERMQRVRRVRDWLRAAGKTIGFVNELDAVC